MPTITLTPTACTASASCKTCDILATTAVLRQLIFTIPNNPTLGGAGVNITGIALYGYARNSSSAVKRLRFGLQGGRGRGARQLGAVRRGGCAGWRDQRRARGGTHGHVFILPVWPRPDGGGAGAVRRAYAGAVCRGKRCLHRRRPARPGQEYSSKPGAPQLASAGDV